MCACLRFERAAIVDHLQQVVLRGHFLGGEGGGHAIDLQRNEECRAIKHTHDSCGDFAVQQARCGTGDAVNGTAGNLPA